MGAKVSAAGLGLALAVVVTLSSCTSPGYDETTRAELREHVLIVAEASAAGDWQAALVSLDAMASALDAAHEAGELGEERLRTILLAMELVRQDLDAAIAAAADDAERVRLIEEQARLQEQIRLLQDSRDAQGGGDQSSGIDQPSGGGSGGSGGSGNGDRSGESGGRGGGPGVESGRSGSNDGDEGDGGDGGRRNAGNGD